MIVPAAMIMYRTDISATLAVFENVAWFEWAL
jgi:hypothetical protein